MIRSSSFLLVLPLAILLILTSGAIADSSEGILQASYTSSTSLSTSSKNEIHLTEIKSTKALEVNEAFLQLPWGVIRTTNYPPELQPGNSAIASFTIKPLPWGGIQYFSLSFNANLMLVTKSSGTVSAPVTITFHLPIWLSMIGVLCGALLQYFFGRYAGYATDDPVRKLKFGSYLIVSLIAGLIIFLAARTGIDLVLAQLGIEAGVGSFSGAIVIGFFSHQLVDKLRDLTRGSTGTTNTSEP